MAESSAGSGQSPISCHFCEERPIKLRCEDCNVLMCQECKVKIHSKLKHSKDHTLIVTETWKEELDFTNIKCSEHAGNYCCLFCKSCRNVICPACIVKNHAGHEMVELSEGHSWIVDCLKTKLSDIKKRKDEASHGMSSLNAQKLKLKRLQEKVESSINEHERYVIDKVKEYFKALRNELSVSSKTCLLPVDTRIQSTTKFTQEADKFIGQLEASIVTKNAAKLFNDLGLMEQPPILKKENIQMPSTSMVDHVFVPRTIIQSDVGYLVKFQVDRKYQTTLSVVEHISECEGGLMIGNCLEISLQFVKTLENTLNILKEFKTEIYGLTVLDKNEILASTGKSNVQKIIIETGKITDSVYDVSPFDPFALHRKDKSLVVGGYYRDGKRGAVIVMNEKGKREAMYENDKENKAMFTCPRSITTTKNNTIHVVDQVDLKTFKSRIVVLDMISGEVTKTYNGHPEVNKDKPFCPIHIITTPLDNVIVTDLNTASFHILNNCGNLLTCYYTSSLGIEYPMSLAFTPTGELYVGCSKPKSSNKKEAKLYLVKMVGC